MLSKQPVTTVYWQHPDDKVGGLGADRRVPNPNLEVGKGFMETWLPPKMESQG